MAHPARTHLVHPPRTHLAARTPKSPPRPVLYPAPPSVIHFSAASRERARAYARGPREVCRARGPCRGLLSLLARSDALELAVTSSPLTVGSWLVSGDRNPSGFL
jgi:hypothetical protein